ncbi:MAG TPA: DUF6111 family protein [Bauldia sp.]|jgi:hypothetical protein|nr:DUF6111 family protein [Bauldia sp.]
MLRFVAFDAIFFLLPFAAYALWLVLTRRTLTNAADWQVRTIGYLALAGAVIVVGILIAFVHLDADAPGGVYVPAHLENGKIVPGHFEAPPKTP